MLFSLTHTDTDNRFAVIVEDISAIVLSKNTLSVLLRHGDTIEYAANEPRETMSTYVALLESIRKQQSAPVEEY